MLPGCYQKNHNSGTRQPCPCLPFHSRLAARNAHNSFSSLTFYVSSAHMLAPRLPSQPASSVEPGRYALSPCTTLESTPTQIHACMLETLSYPVVTSLSCPCTRTTRPEANFRSVATRAMDGSSPIRRRLPPRRCPSLVLASDERCN